MKDKIIKLIKSKNYDDLVIGLELLVHNFDKEDIIELFRENGKICKDSFDYDVIAQIEIMIDLGVRWKYLIYKDISFFVSRDMIQFCNHPAKYSESWENIEL